MNRQNKQIVDQFINSMTTFINNGIGIRYSALIRNQKWMFTRISKDNLIISIDNGNDKSKIYAKKRINPDNYMNWEWETIQEMIERKLNNQQLNNTDLERVIFQII